MFVEKSNVIVRKFGWKTCIIKKESSVLSKIRKDKYRKLQFYLTS
jgi:hypothetical protein